MALASRQMLVTEDLKQYSLSSYDPLISYSIGDIVKNSSGSLYTCTASASAGTLLTNTAFFSPVGGGSIDPTSVTLNSTGTITGKSTSINSSSISATLPTLASANLGDIYYIKVGNFTGCTLNAAGSETIDNSTALINLNPYQGITLRKANSTNWEITSDYVTLTSTGIAQSPTVTTASFQAGELIISSTGDIYKALSTTAIGDSLTDITKFQKITQGNQAYNATTNIPVVAGIPNGTELFVETAGTQTIGGISYDLNKGDLIKKSNAGTYSIIRGQISVRHIEKNTNYSLTIADIPEDTIIGLHNTHATNDIQFTLPAGITTDTLPNYVNTLGTIITVNAGSVVYVRSIAGNKVELLGSDITGSGSGISKTQKTVGANTTLTATDKFAKLTAANIATTLPILSSVKVDDIFVIKNGNFFGNTVVPQGAGVIDGVAGAELLMPYEMMQLRASVGLTEWEKI